jgi:hypothetical protein
MLATLLACGGEKQPAEQSETDATKSAVSAADSIVVELDGLDSATVLDLLLANHEVEYQSTMSGAFVIAVDSVANNSDHFWLYSVNDSMGQTACDKYVTVSGDRVKWHFRKIGI